MRFDRLENFWKGWVIGNFEPSILKTDQFEVAILHHEAGLEIPVHYQKIASKIPAQKPGEKGNTAIQEYEYHYTY